MTPRPKWKVLTPGARHVTGRAVSGDIRRRKALVRPDKGIIKRYTYDKDNFVEVWKKVPEEFSHSREIKFSKSPTSILVGSRHPRLG